jgi:phage-related minor tail protein
VQHALKSWNVNVTADTSQLESALNSVMALGDQFAASLTKAFEQVALQGKSLGDVAKSLMSNFEQLALSTAMKPVQGAISGVLDNLLGGLVAGLGGGNSSDPVPVPFADGGVIAAPVGFNLGDGRPAIAGEAGPEAIMPLARGADGQLGVRGGGAMNVTFNVSTPDVQGFARSESQIAALLSRCVSAGQRNL